MLVSHTGYRQHPHSTQQPNASKQYHQNIDSSVSPWWVVAPQGASRHAHPTLLQAEEVFHTWVAAFGIVIPRLLEGALGCAP